MSNETFDNIQIAIAVGQFLEYGESEYGKSQSGYFSGGGWAARCLRYHQKQLIEAVEEIEIPAERLEVLYD